MFKLLRRYSKPLIPLFIIAVFLLIIRAFSELALPGYMSQIVDYGIGNRGINYVVTHNLTNETRQIIYDMLDNDNIINWNLNNITEELEQEMVYILAYIYNPNFDPPLARQFAQRQIILEYEALGIDLDQMQLDFVFSTGQIMILVAFLAIIAAGLNSLVSSKLAAKLAMQLRNDIFDKVNKFSNTEYNNFSQASLITRCTNDVNQVQQLINMAIRIVIFSPIMAIGGIISVVNTDFSMAWIVALSVFLIILFITIFIIISTPRFKKMQGLIDKINLITRETLNGIMVIRAFTTQKHEENKFNKINLETRKNSIFLARISAFQMPIITLIMNFTIILIVWVGSYSVSEGSLRIGDMMAFIQYTSFIIMSFLMLAMIIIMIPRAQVSAVRIMDVLNYEIVIKDKENAKNIPNNIGIVEFKDVFFKYPNAKEYALKNINFKAENGKTTAIIGSTGSGKTALISLIPRLYDVDSGSVFVNGCDVREVKQYDLRNIIGYAPQKSGLFSGTIESNIKFAGKIDDESMQRAANIAQAAEFIESKDDKYSYTVSQGGANLSGGQKQRLSIARLIAKNPNIYIFDDSFSALDFKTDLKLREAIKKEITNATIIIVAQRIGTIKNADKIIVLDNGEIVGEGTHRHLLQNCDIYKQIAHSQLTDEELEADYE